jgi:hypothetical protein
VAGYGLADAEHQVEKEIGRAWPGSRVAVEEVGRGTGPGSIVETFRVGFRVEGPVDAQGESPEELRRDAFRRARARLAGTRFRGVVWEAAEPR